MKNLEKQTAFITGGGGAIGRAIALRLAADGAAVAVIDMTMEPAENVASEIRAAGGNAKAYVCDVSDYAGVVRCVSEVLADFGGISILVNSAGGSARSKMKLYHEQEIEVIHWMLGVNLFGPMHCIRAISPHMVQAAYGRIINIASIVARGGAERCAEYGAAKGGIIAMTKSLAIELGPYNINVNCVSPGLVQRPGELPADPYAFARKHSCLNRICTQEDIASMAHYLTLGESGYITGQDIAVDGGRSLGLRGNS